MEKVWTNLQKVIQKGGKNEEKTFNKNDVKKKNDFLSENPGNPIQRWAQQTTQINKKHTNLPHKPNNERRRWVRRRWVKKGEWRKVTSKDQLQPSDTPRAPSGPERIYLNSAPPGVPGEAGRILGLRVTGVLALASLSPLWLSFRFQVSISQLMVSISHSSVSSFRNFVSIFQFLASTYRILDDFGSRFHIKFQLNHIKFQLNSWFGYNLLKPPNCLYIRHLGRFGNLPNLTFVI